MRYDSADLELSRPGHWRSRLAATPRAKLFFRAGRPRGTTGRTSRHALGVAYDLFGNGKTAVKFNVGRYLEAITASNNDLDMNPLIRTATNTTRGCDGSTDLVPKPVTRGATSCPDCDLNNPAANGECAGDGQPDPGAAGVLHGPSIPASSAAGAPGRTTGDSACRCSSEVMPRVSVTVAYNRNWWGNWYVVDNRATNFADYTPFSIHAPLDPRLPNGGG